MAMIPTWRHAAMMSRFEHQENHIPGEPYGRVQVVDRQQLRLEAERTEEVVFHSVLVLLLLPLRVLWLDSLVVNVVVGSLSLEALQPLV